MSGRHTASQGSIRELTPGDAEAQYALRRRSLREAPLAFCSSPEDDAMRELAVVRQRLAPTPGQVSLGAFIDGTLVGMVALIRSGRRKSLHRAEIAGMYVAPEARGHDLGRGLLEAAVARARQWGVSHLLLAVNSQALAAQALYSSAGFEVWGREPEAICHDGEVVDTIHMLLRLPAEDRSA